MAQGPGSAGCPVSGSGAHGVDDGLCCGNYDRLQPDAAAPDDEYGNDTYEYGNDTYADDRDVAVERKQHADENDGACDDEQRADDQHESDDRRKVTPVHGL